MIPLTSACSYRIHNAPDLFLGAFRRISSSERGNLLGYVCATRAAEPTLTRASMSTHVPTGPSICIHSVCVVEAERRRGLGVALMHEYLSRLRKDAPSKGYERVLLITHDDLSGFYNRAGFEWMGPSTVQHGIRQWFEMKYELSVSSTRDLQSTAGISINQLPPNITQMDLLAALNRSASKPKATSRRFADFDHGTGDLIVTEGDTKLNKFNLVCPHKGCELIILLNNAVTLIEAESIQVYLSLDAVNLRSLCPIVGTSGSSPTSGLACAAPSTSKHAVVACDGRTNVL